MFPSKKNVKYKFERVKNLVISFTSSSSLAAHVCYIITLLGGSILLLKTECHLTRELYSIIAYMMISHLEKGMLHILMVPS